MTSSIEKEKLAKYVDRIERLNENKSDIQDDIKGVFAEAKADGFDPKALKKLIRIRRQDPKEREEEEETLNLYMCVLGILKPEENS